MKGDFTRNTFDPRNHFTRVLMQQGRVQLDADWNEQAAILLHYLRSLAADLIGPHAGPHGAVGFQIGTSPSGGDGFSIGTGHYYVNGILIENEEIRDENNELVPVTYHTQPGYPDPPALPGLPFLVYLDVWERHITSMEDPEIHEVALGVADTATRAKIVWQVKVEPNVNTCPNDDEWSKLVAGWQAENRGRLKAGTLEFEVDEETEPCTVSPESKYRGPENQLYRVEIHTGGQHDTATFKWSRENGSVVFPILSLSGETLTVDHPVDVALEHLGRDDRFSLREGDWVEIVDDRITLRGEANRLLQVQKIDRDRLVVTLTVPPNVILPVYDETTTSHPLLRRWDHKQLDTTLGYPEMAANGALKLQEDNWLLLEEGIQVYFESARRGDPHTYRNGDYWLIPARTATGDVEWPGPKDDPESLPPHGVYHSYAPIAILADASGSVMADCRREIDQLWTSPPSGAA